MLVDLGTMFGYHFTTLEKKKNQKISQSPVTVLSYQQQKNKPANLLDEFFIFKSFAVGVQICGDLVCRFALIDVQIMCGSNNDIAEYLFFVVHRLG